MDQINILGVTRNSVDGVYTDISPTKKLRSREAKHNFMELIQMQMLNDSQKRAHQKKVVSDARVKKVEDRKHIPPMITAVAMGYFKKTWKNRNTKRGG